MKWNFVLNHDLILEQNFTSSHKLTFHKKSIWNGILLWPAALSKNQSFASEHLFRISFPLEVHLKWNFLLNRCLIMELPLRHPLSIKSPVILLIIITYYYYYYCFIVVIVFIIITIIIIIIIIIIIDIIIYCY